MPTPQAVEPREYILPPPPASGKNFSSVAIGVDSVEAVLERIVCVPAQCRRLRSDLLRALGA
jgi:hypothetical protein